MLKKRKSPFSWHTRWNSEVLLFSQPLVTFRFTPAGCCSRGNVSIWYSQPICLHSCWLTKFIDWILCVATTFPFSQISRSRLHQSRWCRLDNSYLNWQKNNLHLLMAFPNGFLCVFDCISFALAPYRASRAPTREWPRLPSLHLKADTWPVMKFYFG